MKRTHQLDFFRGAFLIIMMLDHALVYNNVVKRFTYEFFGWISAAEGFVFLSGLTAGFVYSHKLAQKGQEYISATANKRAWVIYKNHIALFLFAFVIFFLFDSVRQEWMHSYAAFTHKPGWAIVAGFSLIYQPNYLDILPMYTVFILCVPFIIRWFRNGHVNKVLAGSLVFYAIGSLSELYKLSQLIGPGHELNSRSFNIMSWQLLFVMGLFSGFLFYYRKTKKWQNSRSLFGVAFAISLVFFAAKNLHVESNQVNFNYLIDKLSLGPLRVINFVAFCFVIIFIASQKNKWFKYEPICYLGRYSLEVFSLHIVLILICMPIKTQLNALYSLQLTHTFYFYPFGTLFVFLLMIPAMFLAPRIFGKTGSLPLLTSGGAKRLVPK